MGKAAPFYLRQVPARDGAVNCQWLGISVAGGQGWALKMHLGNTTGSFDAKTFFLQDNVIVPCAMQ